MQHGTLLLITFSKFGSHVDLFYHMLVILRIIHIPLFIIYLFPFYKMLPLSWLVFHFIAYNYLFSYSQCSIIVFFLMLTIFSLSIFSHHFIYFSWILTFLFHTGDMLVSIHIMCNILFFIFFSRGLFHELGTYTYSLGHLSPQLYYRIILLFLGSII